MKILIYKFIHWFNKHTWEDYSVGLTTCYYCEKCGLQKTKLGYKLWWYRVAPWLKDVKEVIKRSNQT